MVSAFASRDHLGIPHLYGVRVHCLCSAGCSTSIADILRYHLATAIRMPVQHVYRRQVLLLFDLTAVPGRGWSDGGWIPNQRHRAAHCDHPCRVHVSSVTFCALAVRVTTRERSVYCARRLPARDCAFEHCIPGPPTHPEPRQASCGLRASCAALRRIPYAIFCVTCAQSGCFTDRTRGRRAVRDGCPACSYGALETTQEGTSSRPTTRSSFYKGNTSATATTQLDARTGSAMATTTTTTTTATTTTRTKL